MAGVGSVPGANSQGYSTWGTNVSPTNLFGNPSTFTAAANKQGSDYDTIMANYANVANNAINNPITAGPSIAPAPTATTAPYTQSTDVTGSLANLSNLSKTGGYTDQGIADLRARGISPTRSIYANAQANLDR